MSKLPPTETVVELAKHHPVKFIAKKYGVGRTAVYYHLNHQKRIEQRRVENIKKEISRLEAELKHVAKLMTSDKYKTIQESKKLGW